MQVVPKGNTEPINNIREEEMKKKKNNGKSTAATRAKNKFRDKNYDRMELALPKGMKSEIAEQVKQGRADSNTAYVIAAVKEKMNRDRKEE